VQIEPVPGSLERVLWLGGGPCAGKSTVADRLAVRHGLGVYHLDDWEEEHLARLDPERQPTMDAFRRMSRDERWVRRTPQVLAAEAMRYWGVESLGLIVEDLRASFNGRSVLVEGPGLYPDCLAPVLAGPDQAVWLVATEQFIRAVRAARPGRFWLPSSDPELALGNIIARDLLLTEHVRETAHRRGFRVVEVSGQEDVEAVTAAVEAHFRRRLAVLRPVRER
jgi:hypothetical protein